MAAGGSAGLVRLNRVLDRFIQSKNLRQTYSRRGLYCISTDHRNDGPLKGRHPVKYGPSARKLTQTTQGRTSDNTRGYGGRVLTAAALGSLSLGLYLKLHGTPTSDCKEVEKKDATEAEAGARRPDLPDFRKSDVIKHRLKESRIWVTYKNGVYDITEFLEGHPGGNKILLAAGGSLEPFWAMYAVHKNPEVFAMLEELRIGNIHPDDMIAAVKEGDRSDPFWNEPERHPALKINSPKPFNGEPPPELLVDNFITPTELFFVRNHLPVPVVTQKESNIQVTGVGMRRPVNLSVADLKKKFKTHKMAATVQCAGNRRSEMRKYKEVKGLNWGSSAISNAEWTGVKLADVLEYAGAAEDKVNHVIFQGHDKDIEGLPYEASIPAETAFDPRKDVLLAFEMNGKPLSRDHGFPVRVVVPGTVGARQVKWLSRIILSENESGSHWQQKDYKTFNPSTDWDTADFSKAVPIQEYPIQSSICEPLDGTTLDPEMDEVTVRGYAWSGGGRGIVRVDISVDGGATWHEAKLESVPQRRHRQWAWTLWETTLPVAPGNKPVEIVCKATDTSHNSQPGSTDGIWNLRGLIHNAWHRVTLPRS